MRPPTFKEIAKASGAPSDPIELVISGQRFVVHANVLGFDQGVTLALANGYPHGFSIDGSGQFPLSALYGARVLASKESAIVLIVAGPEAAMVQRILAESRAAATPAKPEASS